MSYDGHTITVLPGRPCGDTVWTPARKEIAVLGPDGWKRTGKELLGFCEKPKGHSGPCTHLMSHYPR
jgi:hypothetical protein